MVKFTLIMLDNPEALVMSTDVDTGKEIEKASESNRAPSLDTMIP
jgi:hypothetical protein